MPASLKFNSFFRIKKIGEGTGLGLSIIKGILDEYHATIEVLAHSPNRNLN
jgi:signal transduction histidine kinase